MLRVVLLPSLLLAAVVAALAGWFGVSHIYQRPNWDLIYTGDLKAQRQLASCYESIGCPEASYSMVLACAWREIIVEESGILPSSDIAAAKKTCDHLSINERHTVERFEVEIRARLRQSHKKS